MQAERWGVGEMGVRVVGREIQVEEGEGGGGGREVLNGDGKGGEGTKEEVTEKVGKERGEKWEGVEMEMEEKEKKSDRVHSRGGVGNSGKWQQGIKRGTGERNVDWVKESWRTEGQGSVRV